MEFSQKKNVRVGKNVRIEVDEFAIGDGVLIGNNVVLEGPKVTIGDYTVIRENTQVLGKRTCSIGMSCWVGEGCILDATDELRIGNGVGIGANSQLWTHARFGDTLEGCRWSTTKPMTIEDDVWFVGHCLVSPIHAHPKSMAMLGSVITKDMAANRIYAGAPAIDISDKLGAQYRSVTIDEKYETMIGELAQFAKSHRVDGRISIVRDWPENMDPAVSYFNVGTRQYTKRLSDVEIAFMLHLLMPIKFYPAP